MRPLAAPLFAGVFAMLLGACASRGDTGAGAEDIAPRTAWIVGVQGAAIGQAVFTEAPTGVLIRLEFSAGALPPGWHGVHLHATGDCSDFAAGFQASGGHLGMAHGVLHGLRNPQGPDFGDLPNIFAPVAGPFGAELFSTTVTLRETALNGREPLLDANGSALMIHADADDHTSQPIGGAGARIACAALTPLP